ncbi:hypothetical protein BGZ99_006580 [Dissophora globulifera]|uniref:Pyrimidine 5-nucleotidase n=1 Tax=Dissophora globulifera TaxID=979702 RepID=A0A9P6UZG8_9FUNG|nr:hypothetical protein BGZ99_006580 [Dissophora globulifera]
MPSTQLTSHNSRAADCRAHGPHTLDINIHPNQEALGKAIDRTITPNHEPRVFFFDIDNCLYSKDLGMHASMRVKIEKYFEDAGFDNVSTLSNRYYLDYGLAIRGLVINHPDEKVDGSLPLEEILSENKALRDMIISMNVEKKWLFTNAGKKHALRVIKCLGLEGCFDGLTFCDYLEPNFPCKPERESYRRAMRDAGVVHASNCFLVDDSAANVDMALDMGWTGVHVADDPEVSNFGHFQISEILHLPRVLPHLWKSVDTKETITTSSATIQAPEPQVA